MLGVQDWLERGKKKLAGSIVNVGDRQLRQYRKFTFISIFKQ